MRYPSSAKSGVELEALLQRLFIFIIGCVLDDDDIIILVDYSAVFRFQLCLPLRLLLKLQGVAGWRRTS
jgi:hypothetical protein